MTIPTNREHITSGSPDGARVRGLARQVLNEGGTSRQLLASESGALCIFNLNANQTYILPIIGANDVGMFFEFSSTVVSGTGSYSVDTGQSADKIGGGLLMASTTPNESDFIAATIASTVSIDMDSAVTGWLVGSYFKLVVISSTEWTVGGYAVGVGSMATPFA